MRRCSVLRPRTISAKAAPQGSIRKVVGGAVALVSGLFLLLARPAAADPPRVEMPIRSVVLSDGTYRYSILIQLGRSQVTVGLDSGSTGLRVLPRGLAEQDILSAGAGETYQFDSGARFEGEQVRARLSLGGLEGVTTLQRIQTTGCTRNLPRCPVSRLPPAEYAIQGNGLPNEGFPGLFGVNMGASRVPNPLTALGVRRWIIDLPRPGETQNGRLILNPTAEEIQEYQRFDLIFGPNGSAELHDAIPGCVSRDGDSAEACGAVVLDTGAPGLRLVNGGLGPRPWADGATGQLIFTDLAGKPKAGLRFVVGSRQQAAHLRFDFTGSSQPILYAGVTPYFAFSVLYDADAGQIGLKSRPPPQTPSS